MVHAFSGQKGLWASLKLKGEGQPEVLNYGEVVTVRNGSSLSAFSAETATWDTITLEGE
jgi:hypothetical protein